MRKSAIPPSLAAVLTDDPADQLLAEQVLHVMRRRPPATLLQRDALESLCVYPGATTLWLRDWLGHSSCRETYRMMERLCERGLAFSVRKATTPDEERGIQWTATPWGRQCGVVLRSRV